MHRCAITRLEVKHPLTKIIGAEEVNVSIFDTVLACLVDFYSRLRVRPEAGFYDPHARQVQVLLSSVSCIRTTYRWTEPNSIDAISLLLPAAFPLKPSISYFTTFLVCGPQ